MLYAAAENSRKETVEPEALWGADPARARARGRRPAPARGEQLVDEVVGSLK
jgi:hypothetical protein